MTTRSKTQLKSIRKHLKRYGSITPLEALEEYGCFRLAAVIHILREKYKIKTKMIKHRSKLGNVTRFAKYIFKGKKKREA